MQGNIIAYSVDGDFIPIALIHHELSPEKPYQVALYRMKYNAPGSSAASKKSEEKQPKQTQKGQMHLDVVASGSSSSGKVVLSTPASASESSKKKKAGGGREYEYVNIQELYRGLCSKLLGRSSSREGCIMRLLAVLVGLSGTDFSRNLPHVGPVVLWNMILRDERMFAAWMNAFDAKTSQVMVEEACDQLAARRDTHSLFFAILNH